MAAPPSGKAYELWLRDDDRHDEAGRADDQSPATTSCCSRATPRRPPGSASRSSPRRVPRPRRASRSPCSSWVGRLHDAAGSRPRRRRRQRGGRTDGGPRAGTASAGDPLRGRLAPRRPRGHPRGEHARRCRLPSTPASSCTTSAPTRTCCASSTSSGSRPRSPTCRCRCVRTTTASSGPARSASRACSPRGATRCARRTSGCSPRSPGSTGGRGSCLVSRRTSTDGAADETLRSFLDRGGFSPLFRTHFMESLVACVWSCDPAVALDYPARYLFTLPPAPRDAAGLRLAAVAHRHRRLEGVRREGGRPSPRRAHRHQGDLGARDARRAWR